MQTKVKKKNNCTCSDHSTNCYSTRLPSDRKLLILFTFSKPKINVEKKFEDENISDSLYCCDTLKM